jgi:hypothetical protein
VALWATTGSGLDCSSALNASSIISKSTYGDQGQRGKRITTVLDVDDLLVFFAGLRPVDGPSRPLIYAIIGLYVIDEIVSAVSIPETRWIENAHTRRVPTDGEIVVRARARVSGRLRRGIPIGEIRGKVYRVRNDLLDAWGGLDVKDGYIQRSVRLPAFKDAAKFYSWFVAQKPALVAQNNPI